MITFTLLTLFLLYGPISGELTFCDARNKGKEMIERLKDPSTPQSQFLDVPGDSFRDAMAALGWTITGWDPNVSYYSHYIKNDLINEVKVSTHFSPNNTCRK